MKNKQPTPKTVLGILKRFFEQILKPKQIFNNASNLNFFSLCKFGPADFATHDCPVIFYDPSIIINVDGELFIAGLSQSRWCKGSNQAKIGQNIPINIVFIPMRVDFLKLNNINLRKAVARAFSEFEHSYSDIPYFALGQTGNYKTKKFIGRIKKKLRSIKKFKTKKFKGINDMIWHYVYYELRRLKRVLI
ncbi:MAG: hypothetical protein WC621_05120 [Patescibacteria group bacterium]